MSGCTRNTLCTDVRFTVTFVKNQWYLLVFGCDGTISNTCRCSEKWPMASRAEFLTCWDSSLTPLYTHSKRNFKYLKSFEHFLFISSVSCTFSLTESIDIKHLAATGASLTCCGYDQHILRNKPQQQWRQHGERLGFHSEGPAQHVASKIISVYV